MGLRVKVLAVLVLVMFATLTTRLWFLQVLASEQYKSQAKDNAVRLIEVPAPRGVIKDANGTLLVQNRGSVVITINRQELGDQTERVLLDLSELLDIPADELGARLDDPRYYVFSPIPVATDVPKRVAYFIKEHAEDFPGVDVLSVPVRRYPLGSAGAHVLGYLGQISKAKLKDPGFADYSPGDVIGVSGIEGIYERYLAGTRGLVKYRVNSIGENLGLIGRQLPVAGDDVWLTLDADTQELAEDSLQGGDRARPHGRGVRQRLPEGERRGRGRARPADRARSRPWPRSRRSTPRSSREASRRMSSSVGSVRDTATRC